MPSDPSHVQAQLALALSNNMQKMMERRDEAQTRRGAQLVQDGVAMGMVGLSAPGESTAVVDFAMSFAEKPIFTFGFELGPSSWIEHGSFPVGTAIVMSWQTKTFSQMTTWTGATLAIVITGVAGPSVCHYQFMGRSLSTPTGTSQ